MNKCLSFSFWGGQSLALISHIEGEKKLFYLKGLKA